MKNETLILSLFFLVILINPIELLGQQTLKVVDIDTNDPVSYSVIMINDNRIINKADIDGLINLEINKNLNYSITRLGYNKIDISGANLLSSGIVRMKILPIEINPIIVTADDAWRDLNRAIENTYNLIPKTPFYLGCWQNDSINVDENNVISAKAMYVSKVYKLSKIYRGSNFLTKLKGLKLINNSNINVDTISNLRYYDVPNVNQFGIGNHKTDKELLFYFLNINDTSVIIGYKPKATYEPKGKTVSSSGRFVINKGNWTLIRFDSDLSPKIILKNKLVGTKSKYQYKSYKRSILFDNKGIMSKLQEIVEFTVKSKNLNTTWTNTLVQVYNEIKEKDYLVVPFKLVQSKSIINQKPFFTASFDSEFEKGIH